MKGLNTLERFLAAAAAAATEREIVRALTDKMRHSDTIAREFIRNGLRDTMFS